MASDGADPAPADGGGAGDAPPGDAPPADPAGDTPAGDKPAGGEGDAAPAGGDGDAPADVKDREGDDDASLLADAGDKDKAKDGEGDGEGEAKDGEGDKADGPPETYELSIKDAEGNAVELDPALIEQASPIFKELGLSNEQANKLGELYANTVLPKLIEQQQQAAIDGIVAQAKTWASAVLSDPDLGGGKAEVLNENLTHAARFRDAFGDAELKEFLRESALGNHPALVRLFVKAGKALAEDGFHLSDRGSAPAAGDDGKLFYGDAFSPKSAS